MVNKIRKIMAELIYFPSHGALTYEQCADRADQALVGVDPLKLAVWEQALGELTEDEWEAFREGERTEMEGIATRYGLQELSTLMDDFFDPLDPEERAK